jgi:hypothetical protein
MYPTHHNTGFIALTTTIILSLIILTLVIAVGFASFFTRFSILDSEINERSSNLAEACVETAVLKLSQDEDYPGGDTVTVGTASCYICPTVAAGSNVRVFVQALSSNAFTNLRVDVDPDSGIVAGSWQEIPTITISGGTCTTS